MLAGETSCARHSRRETFESETILPSSSHWGRRADRLNLKPGGDSFWFVSVKREQRRKLHRDTERVWHRQQKLRRFIKYRMKVRRDAMRRHQAANCSLHFLLHRLHKTSCQTHRFRFECCAEKAQHCFFPRRLHTVPMGITKLVSFHVDTLKIKPGSCSSSKLLTQCMSDEMNVEWWDEMNVEVNGSNEPDNSVNWRMVRWAPSRFLCSLRLHGRFVFAASTIEFYIQCCSQTDTSRPTGQQVGSAVAHVLLFPWGITG